MSQQYPQQPQQPEWGQQPTQPGYGYPTQPGYPQPQPPKKRSLGKILGIVAAGFVGIIVIAAIAGGGGDSSDSSNKDKAVTVDSSKPADKSEDTAAEPAKEEPAEDKSQAEEFKDCVAKSGTPAEKKAIGHVIKVTGADKNNDIMDTAEVFTDYTGGLVGPHAADGKLIASAFASCYESKNGLVTVYDEKGEILSNGNY